MTRGPWGANADPRSGFDIHDPSLHGPHPTPVTEWTEDEHHLRDLIRKSGRRAEQARIEDDERRRKLIAAYEAGLAKKAGDDVRHRIAEMWGGAA